MKKSWNSTEKILKESWKNPKRILKDPDKILK